MVGEDYPKLWRSSDRAAASCQRRYLALVRAHLITLCLVGMVACWNPVDKGEQRLVAWMVAGLTLFAFAFGVSLKLSRLDDSWFKARAFAESAKEACWRFMMTPLPTGAAPDDAPARYMQDLKDIRDRFPETIKLVIAHDVEGEEITVRMSASRSGDALERREMYLRKRVDDQVGWYKAKARFNGSMESRWFWVILIMEILAIAVAFVRVGTLDLEFNPTGGVAAVAACAVAWMQTKRFSDLANTYSVAAGDLEMIRERYKNARTEDELRALVQETESAISREHQLWVERRVAV